MFRLGMIAAAICGLAAPAAAQEDVFPFLVELNKATEKAGACEIVVLVRNGMGQAVSDISLKLAVVDSGGQFSSMLSLPLGAMRDQDSKFASYTLQMPCTGLSKIIINDVDRCTLAGSGGASELCNASLQVNSREAGIEMAL
jgi:hypothetical protein